MPRLKDETIENNFYRRFSLKSPDEQRGIIGVLSAIMTHRMKPTSAQAELPLEEGVESTDD